MQKRSGTAVRRLERGEPGTATENIVLNGCFRFASRLLSLHFVSGASRTLRQDGSRGKDRRYPFFSETALPRDFFQFCVSALFFPDASLRVRRFKEQERGAAAR